MCSGHASPGLVKISDVSDDQDKVGVSHVPLLGHGDELETPNLACRTRATHLQLNIVGYVYNGTVYFYKDNIFMSGQRFTPASQYSTPLCHNLRDGVGLV